MSEGCQVFKCFWSVSLVQRLRQKLKEPDSRKGNLSFYQCFRSGLDPDSIRSVDPDRDPGSKNDPPKIEKSSEITCLNC
jgi:hypothetical protein